MSALDWYELVVSFSGFIIAGTMIYLLTKKGNKH